MKRKRSIFRRFNRRNLGLIPRRIGRCSSQLDTSLGRVVFGDKDSNDRKSSHVVSTVVASLIVSYGASRTFGSAFARHISSLESDSLLTSGWGGMLVLLLLLTGFNTASPAFTPNIRNSYLTMKTTPIAVSSKRSSYESHPNYTQVHFMIPPLFLNLYKDPWNHHQADHRQSSDPSTGLSQDQIQRWVTTWLAGFDPLIGPESQMVASIVQRFYGWGL